jgi:hypothetical protein
MDKVIVAGIGMVTVMIVLALFGAFTISTLWAWFVVPLGVKAVTTAHAYGLSVIVSVFMGSRGLGGDSSTVLIQGVLINIFALIFGGIAVNFM